MQILVLPGDGIGPEITAATRQVLDAASVRFALGLACSEDVVGHESLRQQLTATLLGTVSHVPSSLGIIEAALLIGLPQFGREELLASLLTFRVIYFVIPFLLATLALGLRELGLVARPKTCAKITEV